MDLKKFLILSSVGVRTTEAIDMRQRRADHRAKPEATVNPAAPRPSLRPPHVKATPTKAAIRNPAAKIRPRILTTIGERTVNNSLQSGAGPTTFRRP